MNNINPTTNSSPLSINQNRAPNKKTPTTNGMVKSIGSTPKRKAQRKNFCNSSNPEPFIPPILKNPKQAKNNITLKQTEQKTLSEECEVRINRELIKWGLSQESRQDLIKIFQKVPFSESFSFLTSLNRALHYEVSIFLEFYKSAIKNEIFEDNIKQLQNICYYVSFMCLLKENFFTNIPKESVCTKECQESILKNVEHISGIISDTLNMFSLKKFFYSDLFTTTFLFKYRIYKDKSLGNKALKEVQNKALKHADSIEKLLRTINEVFKLRLYSFVNLENSKNVQDTICTNFSSIDSPSIEDDVKSYHDFILDVFKYAQANELILKMNLEVIESYKEMFEILYKQINKHLKEEEIFKTMEMYKNFQSKSIETSPISNQNTLDKESLIDTLSFATFFSTYSLTLLCCMCKHIDKKNPFFLSIRPLIQIFYLREKINLLKEEERTYKTITHLVSVFKKQLSPFLTEEVMEWLQGIIDFSEYKFEEILQNLEFINNNLNCYTWNDAKNNFKGLKEDATLFQEKFIAGCASLENILSASSMTYEDFKVLEGRILAFKTDISEILKPLVDLPPLLDNLLSKKQSSQEILCELDLEAVSAFLEEELEFPIDFKKLEASIQFLDPPQDTNEDSLENPILTEKKETEIAMPLIEIAVQEVDPIEEPVSQEKPIERTTKRNQKLKKTQKKEVVIEETEEAFPHSAKTKEILHFLKEKGFVYVSKKGSHTKFRSLKNGNTVIIPFHSNKEIAKGTVGSIARQFNGRN